MQTTWAKGATVYDTLYTLVWVSWPPLKLQFQFDHTRRVIDARSRIYAIDLRITLLYI